MSSFISALSGFFTKIFGLIFSPFLPDYRWLGLFLASAVAGVLLLLLYGAISNQKRIVTVKGGIYRDLLEAIIFRHQIGTSLKAQLRMLWGAVKYFALAVPPLLILAIPCIIFLSQLNLFFGQAPLAAGKTSLVAIELEKGAKAEKLKIVQSDGLQIAGPVRDAKLGLAYIRVSPQGPGVHNLVIEAGGSQVSIPILSKQYLPSISSVISLKPFDQLFYASPLIQSLRDSKIARVSIGYDEQHYSLAGMSMHWLVFFFVVSFISGLFTCKIFKIEI